MNAFSAVGTDAGLHLTLPDTRDAVDICRLAIVRFLEPAAPSQQAMFRLELIQEECLMNIIWHAFDDDSEHSIAVHATVDGGHISLVFEDSGRPFDPTQVADPQLPANLQDAVPGGLGLMLVRRFASSVTYRRHEGHNQLSVTLPLH
ncbi:MAG: ATP-binding protein [Burkholderiales bacterium]|nr:MAG: ATP-binding protein [Burkholderiales bacterium]